MTSITAQSLTPLTHALTAIIAIVLLVRKNKTQKHIALTLLAYSIIGIVYWVTLKTIPSDIVPGHVLSRWRSFFQAIVILGYTIGLL